MKIRDYRVATKPQLVIIPMIDIIFFLLVFFMMSTLYMMETNAVNVNLPRAATAQNTVTKQVDIVVTAEGKVFIGQEEVAPELLSKRIRLEVNRSADMSFVIRADRKAEHGKVIAVLDELKKNGVQRAGIAADPQ